MWKGLSFHFKGSADLTVGKNVFSSQIRSVRQKSLRSLQNKTGVFPLNKVTLNLCFYKAVPGLLYGFCLKIRGFSLLFETEVLNPRNRYILIVFEVAQRKKPEQSLYHFPLRPDFKTGFGFLAERRAGVRDKTPVRRFEVLSQIKMITESLFLKKTLKTQPLSV